MPLDPEFVAQALYGPGGQMIDELLEVNQEKSLVRVRMPTHDDLPLTREQRVHPVLHPRHVSGGLMIHMTGVVGFVHAWYIFGLRPAEGWTGYGVRIHNARFCNLAVPPEPMELTGWCTHSRKGTKQILSRYSFEFRQGDKLIYEGDQTAMWTKLPL